MAEKMKKEEDDLLQMFIKMGYLKENIIISDVVIDSTEKYQELYKRSKGSYSDFEKGWCFFYANHSGKPDQVKGTLHKVRKGVKFETREMGLMK